MTDIKVLVWKTRDAVGEPEVEVRIPASMAKWVPKIMAFMPKKTQAELWGDNPDIGTMIGNLEQLVAEATASGATEVMDVKTKDSHVKILVQK